MYIKKFDIEKTLANGGQYVFIENEKLFIDDNLYVHERDSILELSLDKHGVKGTFSAPAMNWNGPKTGELIKSKMSSGNYAYFLITSWTQDYVMRTGSVIRLCYVQHWNNFIEQVRINE